MNNKMKKHMKKISKNTDLAEHLKGLIADDVATTKTMGYEALRVLMMMCDEYDWEELQTVYARFCDQIAYGHTGEDMILAAIDF